MPINIREIGLCVFEHLDTLNELKRKELFDIQQYNLKEKLNEIDLNSQIKASFPKIPVKILSLGSGAGEEIALMPFYLIEQGILIESITAVDLNIQLLESYENCNGVHLFEKDILTFLKENKEKYDLIFWCHPNIFNEEYNTPLDYFIPSLHLLQNAITDMGFIYIGCYSETEINVVQANSNFFDPEIKKHSTGKSFEWNSRFTGKLMSKTPHLFSAISTPSCRKQLEEKQRPKPVVPELLSHNHVALTSAQPEPLELEAKTTTLVNRHRFMPPVPNTRTEEDVPKKAEGCCSQLFKLFGF